MCMNFNLKDTIEINLTLIPKNSRISNQIRNQKLEDRNKTQIHNQLLLKDKIKTNKNFDTEYIRYFRSIQKLKD